MGIRVRDTLSNNAQSSETVESSPFFAKPDVGHDESNEMQYKAVERKTSKERGNGNQQQYQSKWIKMNSVEQQKQTKADKSRK
jgi:hypothetical protein